MNKQHNMLFAGSLFWFAFVYWFAARGGFVSGLTQSPITLAAAYATPLLLFLAAVRIALLLKRLQRCVDGQTT
jgi:hypothetical protein